MGAAGDMLMAALYELLDAPRQQAFLRTMNGLFGNVSVRPVQRQTCGIVGTGMEVLVNGTQEEAGDGQEAHPHAHDHEHPQEHRHDHDHVHDQDHRHDHIHAEGRPHFHAHTAPETIRSAIAGLDLPDEVKADAQAVYDAIAGAEAHAHGMPVEQIHFHEVGSLDAVADVTGVCLALHLLQPDRILASEVHVGSGEVHCAHGVLPVPAPATAYLLRGIPTYGGQIRGELCTPTGAALLAHFVSSFGPMPPMAVSKIGYGIGKKEFPAANCVRAFWAPEAAEDRDALLRDEVTELCCHIDDMTAEMLSFAGGRLMGQGALDVAFAPLTMKKGRPGISLTVLCRPEDEEKMARAVLRETTTNGVRVRHCGRYCLQPSSETVTTAYGDVRVKCADGGGISRRKPEYEDAARIARAQDLPIGAVYEAVRTAERQQEGQEGR